jgi:hypothetical protein
MAGAAVKDHELQERWDVRLQIVWGREPITANWRRRLGHVLRRLADRLDGRRSWAIALHGNPPLSARAMHDCFKQGAIAIEHAAVAECRIEAQERIMARAHPQLFAR